MRIKVYYILPIILFFVALSSLPAQEPVSLAVFPFNNMNGNQDQDYLTGIISILVEDLSQSGSLRIVEREKYPGSA